MSRQAMNSITVHLRTAKLRDQANQLLTLHDDIAELKAAYDVDGGLNAEIPGRNDFVLMGGLD